MPKSEQAVQQSSTGKLAIAGIGGVFAGAAICVAVLMAAMPSLMIRTYESRLGFDQTVADLETAVKSAGWHVSGVVDMNKSMATQGVQFTPRVTLIKLCKAEYAQSVLSTDRQVSTMMPCTISVWEDEHGKVNISKLNTALMGRVFGGNVADVMGGKVSTDEKKMLAGLIKK